MINLKSQDPSVDTFPFSKVYTGDASPLLARVAEKSKIEIISQNKNDNTGTATILIVDDDAEMRKILKLLLQDMYNVVTATNGIGALKKINKHLPTLIITDIIMPGMDGIRLLKKLRRNSKTSRIPIIAISVHGAEEAKIKGFNAGANDYLIKPFSKNELLARIYSLIKIAQAATEAEMNMHNIFMQLPMPICILKGVDYNVEVANDLYLQLVGKDKAVINKSLFQSLPELKTQSIKELLDNVVQSGIPYYSNETELQVNRGRKGEMGFFNFVYQPIIQVGNVTGVMVVVTEVTDLVLSRRKIEDRETFNRTVLESSPDCIKILDAEGRIQFMNINGQCAMEIDDFTKIKNKYWWQMWGDESRQMLEDAVIKALNVDKVHFQAPCPTN